MRILLLQAEFFNALVFADLCYCSYYVCPVAYLPRQSASRRSAGISKDYSSTSSTSLLYLQCFVQIHLIVHLIKLLYIIHFGFMGSDHLYLSSHQHTFVLSLYSQLKHIPLKPSACSFVLNTTLISFFTIQSSLTTRICLCEKS